MQSRKEILVTGDVHHVFTKSIMKYIIFRDDHEYMRIKNLVKYYSIETQALKFSTFSKIKDKQKFNKIHFDTPETLVKIISYCFMPTHIHLVLRQEKDNGISKFMNNILNSYSRYFNLRTKRKGPLWEARFKNVKVETDEQLMHLTRYLHLNPTTASLVKRPGNWQHSSYQEYLGKIEENECMCEFSEFLEIKPKDYKEFVNSNASYQRELGLIKNLFLD